MLRRVFAALTPSAEPVIAGYLTLVVAIVAVCVAFGVHLTDAQFKAIIGLAVALAPVVSIIRSKVTPTRSLTGQTISVSPIRVDGRLLADAVLSRSRPVHQPQEAPVPDLDALRTALAQAQAALDAPDPSPPAQAASGIPDVRAAQAADVAAGDAQAPPDSPAPVAEPQRTSDAAPVAAAPAGSPEPAAASNAGYVGPEQGQPVPAPPADPAAA